MIEPTSKDIGRAVTVNRSLEAELVGFDHIRLYLRFGKERASTPALRAACEWSTKPGEVISASLSRLTAAGIQAVDQGDKSFLVAGNFTLNSNGSWKAVDGSRIGYDVDTLIRAVKGEPAPQTKAQAEQPTAAAEHQE